MPAINDVGQPRDDRDREPDFRPDIPRDEHYSMYLGKNELRAMRALQTSLNEEAARRGMAFREQPDVADMTSISIYFFALRLRGYEETDALKTAITMTVDPESQETQEILQAFDDAARRGES